MLCKWTQISKYSSKPKGSLPCSWIWGGSLRGCSGNPFVATKPEVLETKFKVCSNAPAFVNHGSLWWEHEVEGEGGLSMSMETLLSLYPWGNVSHLLAKTWYAWSAPPPGLSLTNCEWQQTFCSIIKEEDEEIFLQAWSVHYRALHFPRRLDSLWQ